MELIDLELYVLTHYFDEIDFVISKYSGNEIIKKLPYIKWTLYKLKESDYSKYKLLIDSFFVRVFTILSSNNKTNESEISEEDIILYEKLGEITSLEQFENLILGSVDSDISILDSLDDVSVLYQEDDGYNEDLMSENDVYLKQIISLITNDGSLSILKSYYLFANCDKKLDFSYIYQNKVNYYKMIGLSLTLEGFLNYYKYMEKNDHDASDELAFFISEVIVDGSPAIESFLKQVILEFYVKQKYMIVNNLVSGDEYDLVLDNIDLIENHSPVEVLEMLLSDVDFLAAVINVVFDYRENHMIEEEEVSFKKWSRFYMEHINKRVTERYSPYQNVKMEMPNINRLIEESYLKKIEYLYEYIENEPKKKDISNVIDIFQKLDKQDYSLNWIFYHLKDKLPHIYRLLLENIIIGYFIYCDLNEDELDNDDLVVLEVIKKARDFAELEQLIFDDKEKYYQVLEMHNVLDIFSFVNQKDDDLESDYEEKQYSDEISQPSTDDEESESDISVECENILISIVSAGFIRFELSDVALFSLLYDMKKLDEYAILKQFKSTKLDDIYYRSIGLNNSYDGFLTYYQNHKDEDDEVCYDIAISLTSSNYLDSKNIIFYIIKTYYKIAKYLISVDATSLKKYVNMIEKRDIEHTFDYFFQNPEELSKIMEIVFNYDLYGVCGKNVISIPYDELEVFASQNTPQKVKQKLFIKGASLN